MVKLNFDVKTHILKNGLEVITIKKNTQISSINIGIKVGALNESLEEKGISHYIEHMIFKGTKNRTFQKLNDELEALGGEYNAFTDYSQTVYHCAGSLLQGLFPHTNSAFYKNSYMPSQSCKGLKKQYNLH